MTVDYYLCCPASLYRERERKVEFQPNVSMRRMCVFQARLQSHDCQRSIAFVYGHPRIALYMYRGMPQQEGGTSGRLNRNANDFVLTVDFLC